MILVKFKKSNLVLTSIPVHLWFNLDRLQLLKTLFIVHEPKSIDKLKRRKSVQDFALIPSPNHVFILIFTPMSFSVDEGEFYFLTYDILWTHNGTICNFIMLWLFQARKNVQFTRPINMMKDAEKANIAKLDRLIEETETIKHVHQAKKVCVCVWREWHIQQHFGSCLIYIGLINSKVWWLIFSY